MNNASRVSKNLLMNKLLRSLTMEVEALIVAEVEILHHEGVVEGGRAMNL
jgi:hypothetical protein